MKSLFKLSLVSLTALCLMALPVRFVQLAATAQELQEYFEENKKKEVKPEEKKVEEKKEKQEEKMEEMMEEQKEKPKKQNVGEPELMPDFPEEIPEELQYFKDVYEETFTAPFEVVYKAVKSSLEDLSCQTIKDAYKQTDDGFFKGFINSDYCVVASGQDSTIDVMKKFSFAASEEKLKRKRFPIIRGGTWLYGRMQYKMVITEKENGSVHVLLKGELSGFESYVTNRVHFWDSNGYLEQKMLERIRRHVAAASK